MVAFLIMLAMLIVSIAVIFFVTLNKIEASKRCVVVPLPAPTRAGDGDIRRCAFTSSTCAQATGLCPVFN